MSDNKLVKKNQFGCVTKSSSLAACTKLMNFIETNLDKKKVVAYYFLDIKKAYDSVDHNILFQKLEEIGIKHKS